MAEFVNTIDLVGDDAVIDGIIERHITEFIDNTVTVVGLRAFYECSELTRVDMPSVTDIGDYAFARSGLTAVSLPNCKTSGSYAFAYCNSLETVELPSLTSLKSRTLSECKLLREVRFQSVTSVESYSLASSQSLAVVDFHAATSIAGNALYGSGKLKALILRNSTTVCAALGASMVPNTTSYIYVPRALIEDYKVATNWSTYAEQFRALEDYTVDSTTTGELDDTKIEVN